MNLPLKTIRPLAEVCACPPGEPERVDCPDHSWRRLCADCGHGHGIDIPCPDHPWRDRCPYYGLGCLSEV